LVRKVEIKVGSESGVGWKGFDSSGLELFGGKMCM